MCADEDRRSGDHFGQPLASERVVQRCLRRSHKLEP
jgi:hypothetical protein